MAQPVSTVPLKGTEVVLVKLARHSPLLFSLFNYRGQSSRFTYPPADAGGTDTPSLTVGLRPRIRRRYLCAVTGAFAILADTVSVVTSPSTLQTLALRSEALATRSRTATARQEALVTRYQSSFRSPAKAGLSR